MSWVKTLAENHYNATGFETPPPTMNGKDLAEWKQTIAEIKDRNERKALAITVLCIIAVAIVVAILITINLEAIREKQKPDAKTRHEVTKGIDVKLERYRPTDAVNPENSRKNNAQKPNLQTVR